MEREDVIKETKYCQILAQSKVTDGEYTYTIEKIYVKQKRRDEIRFCLYKDTVKHLEKYIPRSLDVTETEFLDLFREAIRQEVFSKELLYGLRLALGNKKSNKIIHDETWRIEEEMDEKWKKESTALAK